MTKPAVLFDFGGVFMKTVNYRPRRLWDERLGLPHGSVEQIVHGSPSWRAVQTGQLDVESYWADVGKQLGLDADDVYQLASDFFSGDQLDLDLVEYSRSLRQRGYSVALLSNDSPTLTDKLRTLRISDLFDPTVISAQIGVMKPDAKAFQAALERLGRPATEVIFVDDLEANVDGARKLGIHAIHYTTTPALQAALENKLKSGL